MTDAERKMTRDDFRAALLAKRPQSRSVLISLFGTAVELRQPSLGDIMRAQDVEDPAERAAMMVIRYACIPGTDERIIEEGDKEAIISWPFGEDMVRLQEAIADLTGINIDSAKAELKRDPL